jgi:hypothetical protein
MSRPRQTSGLLRRTKEWNKQHKSFPEQIWGSSGHCGWKAPWRRQTARWNPARRLLTKKDCFQPGLWFKINRRFLLESWITLTRAMDWLKASPWGPASQLHDSTSQQFETPDSRDWMSQRLQMVQSNTLQNLSAGEAQELENYWLNCRTFSQWRATDMWHPSDLFTPSWVTTRQDVEDIKGWGWWRRTFPWSSSIIPFRKNGTFQFCVDCWWQNCFLIPRIDDIPGTLSGTSWFSTLDLNGSYWQVAPQMQGEDSILHQAGLRLNWLQLCTSLKHYSWGHLCWLVVTCQAFSRFVVHHVIDSCYASSLCCFNNDAPLV